MGPPCNPPTAFPPVQPSSPRCLGAAGCAQKPGFFQVNELLKKGSFALNGDGTWTTPDSKTHKVVEYWGNDFAMRYDEGGKFVGCAGSFFGCPEGAQVTFQVTACGVTSASTLRHTASSLPSPADDVGRSRIKFESFSASHTASSHPSPADDVDRSRDLGERVGTSDSVGIWPLR